MLGAGRVKPLLSLSAVVAMTSEAIAPVSRIQAKDAPSYWYGRTSLTDVPHRTGPAHEVSDDRHPRRRRLLHLREYAPDRRARQRRARHRLLQLRRRIRARPPGAAP